MRMFRKSGRSRRLLLVGTAALIATLAVAVPAIGVSLPGANFEIDNNANLVVNGAAPAIDWVSVTETRQTDQATGQQDDSFGNGTKEDTPVPSVIDGSIPNNKSDLLNFGVYLETNANGRFLNLFWHRVQEPSGTTNMDFEFNQSEIISGNGVTPVRTAGDVLIQYDLSQGGVNPVLFLSRWVTTGAGSQCEGTNSVPCWSTKANLSAAGDATGSINSTPILAANSDGLGNVSARTFGEAQLDFDALTGGGAGCSSFGSAYLKSRSSDSFTAALKDFIAPTDLDLDNCAVVTIRKETDPEENPNTTDFDFTNDYDTDPANDGAFTLQDDGVNSDDDVLFGTGYTVTEDLANLPDGWDLASINCNVAGHPSSGVTPDININNGTVTFDIDSAADVLDCTYTNRARATIIVEKITDDGTGSFDFTSTTLTPSPFTLTTTAAGAGGKDSATFGELTPGTYDVAETVPAGWNLVSSSCDDGSSPGSIGLSPGETVTCTFHDARERGAILIAKTRKHAAAGPGDHPHPQVTFTVTGGSLPAAGVTVQTGSDGTACVGDLVVSGLVGNYTVTETVPDGYVADGDVAKTVAVANEATCDPVTGTPAPVSFSNTPLTDVTVSVDSQIDGGTASIINCGSAGSGSTGANGDGSVEIEDLEPTAPAATVVCTITVDP